MSSDNEFLAHIPEAARQWIDSWRVRSSRFAEFVLANESKIKRKFKNARTNEDAYDVLAELEISFRLLGNSLYGVEYEPYGAESGTSPDFRVKNAAGDFHVETKQIREAAATVLFNECKGRLISALRAVPSPLGVSVDCYSLEEGPEFSKRVNDVIDLVITECVDTLNRWKDEILDDETRTFHPTALPEFEITFTHVPGKPADSPTANLSCVSPILFTQKESFKFTDLLLGCLRQLRAGLGNILIIRLQSITHESRELPFAVNEIFRLAKEGNHDFFQAKGFESVHDFEAKFALLSAAVIISDSMPSTLAASRNEVWVNPSPAISLSDKDIVFFEKM